MSFGYLHSDSYDYYGSAAMYEKHQKESSTQSTVLKEQQLHQDHLISNINIVKIGNDEAITLNNYLLENTDFFLKCLRATDPNFLMTELKIEKTDTSTALKESVLRPTSSQDEKSEAPAQTGRKQQVRNREQDVYFLISEREPSKTSAQQAVIPSSDFRSRTSQYTKMGTKSHPQSEPETSLQDSAVSFAQVFSHIFEKAINVHFQEFQGKLSNQMKDFFFTQDQNNIYTDDLRLAQFWKELRPAEANKIWEGIDKTIEGVVGHIKATDEYAKSNTDFEKIDEEGSDSQDKSEQSDAPYTKKQKAKSRRFDGAETKVSGKESPATWRRNMQDVQDKINRNGEQIQQ